MRGKTTCTEVLGAGISPVETSEKTWQQALLSET